MLRLVARSTSNRAIAGVLCTGGATVKTHLTHSYGTSGVRDAAAVAVGYDRGILGRIPAG